MSKRLKIISCLVVVFLGVVAAFVSIAISLWVPWFLLPEAPLKVAWTPVLRSLVTSSTLLPAEVSAHLVWHAAYARGEGETLVLLPNMLGQMRLAAELANAGWQVQRLGWYVYATKGASPVTAAQVRQAGKSLVMDQLRSRQPLYPSGLLEVAHMGAENIDPLLLIVVKRGDAFRVVSTPAGSAAYAGPVVVPAFERWQVSAAGQLWQLDHKAFWNDIAWQQFGFKNTRPQMQAVLAQLPYAALVSPKQDQLAVVAEDPNQVLALAATAWVQEEERQTRLVNRAFRLPDNTIGYERVPGAAQPVFAPADAGGCQGPLEQRTTLWLCQRNGVTVLGTSEVVAQEVLRTWQQQQLAVVVGQAALTRLKSGCEQAGQGIVGGLCQLDWVTWEATVSTHTGSFRLISR